MSTRETRAAGLGALLAAPTPSADEDPDFAAHQARRAAKQTPEKAPAKKAPAKGRSAAKKAAPPAAPADTPQPAAPAEESVVWLATDTTTYEEIARVEAPDQKKAIAAVTEQTGRRGGFAVSVIDPDTQGPALVPARTARATGALAQRGAPAVLPRKRVQRVAKEKLTCQVPVSVLDALDALIQRDDTRKYDEVEEALRAHLAKKGIELDED